MERKRFRIALSGRPTIFTLRGPRRSLLHLAGRRWGRRRRRIEREGACTTAGFPQSCTILEGLDAAPFALQEARAGRLKGVAVVAV